MSPPWIFDGDGPGEGFDPQDLLEGLSGDSATGGMFGNEQIGASDSGTGIVRPDGGFYQVAGRKGLSLALAQDKRPIGGVAMVTVGVEDFTDAASPAPAGAFAQRLVLELSYGTGIAGDDRVQIDAQIGTQFSMGGVNAITVGARILDVDTDGAPTQPGFAQRVSVTLHWAISANPKPAYFTPHRVAFEALEQGPFPIPKRAISMIVQTTVPAGAAGMIARFLTTNAVGAPLFSRTDNPLDRGTVILSPMRAYTLAAGVAMVMSPVFELSL